MKKIQFIIILTITVLLSGCTVEKNDLKNGKGASAAAYWLDATEEVLMRCPDVAFKFNTWLNAPDDQKDSIKHLYFPNYEIQERPDNRWFFYLNGRRIFRSPSCFIILRKRWLRRLFPLLFRRALPLPGLCRRKICASDICISLRENNCVFQIIQIFLPPVALKV